MLRYFTCILILFTLFSCKKEEEVVIEEPWECLPCGTYQGLYSGYLQVPLTGTDTIFYNLQAMVDVTEGSNDSINLAFDLSNLLGAPTGSSVITLNQAYWIDSIIQGEDNSPYPYSYYYIIDATCLDSFNDLQGEIVISGDVNCEFTFEVNRQ